MDSLIASAARALAAGDPLGALKRVALRDDPPAPGTGVTGTGVRSQYSLILAESVI
jgi:hypothetical protein